MQILFVSPKNIVCGNYMAKRRKTRKQLKYRRTRTRTRTMKQKAGNTELISKIQYYNQNHIEPNLDVIKQMIDNMTLDEINAKNKIGQNTALIVASRCGFDKIVDLLIKKGANLKLRNEQGQTALDWAVAMRRKGVIELLLDAGAGPIDNVMTEEEYKQCSTYSRELDKVIDPLTGLDVERKYALCIPGTHECYHEYTIRRVLKNFDKYKDRYPFNQITTHWISENMLY